MHFHNILLQIQYSVTKPIEILHTIAITYNKLRKFNSKR